MAAFRQTVDRLVFTLFALHTTVGARCNLENIMFISQKSELGTSRSERNLSKLKKDAGVG